MPIYRYRGYTAKGLKVSGVLEADTASEALKHLKNKDVYPEKITLEVYKKRHYLFSREDYHGLSHITGQLSILITSGVSILDAIKTLSEQSKGDWKNILSGLKERVSSGSSLSKAMEAYHPLFPEFYISMINAGESGGNLDLILDKLTGYLSSKEEIGSKIRSAIMYPLFMFIVSILVLSSIFIFVIPKIVKIFEDAIAAIPLITLLLIKISNLFQNYGWLILLSLLPLSFAAKMVIKKKDLLIDSLLYKLDILQVLYISRFLRTTGFLLDGGVPLPKSLQIAAKSTGNRFLENQILMIEKRVAEGASLASSLTVFPPIVIQIISTGEKGGRLSEMFQKAADSYEKDFDYKIKRYLSLLEPTMILVMGLVIGFIVFAILLPIFEINQLIK